MPTALALSPHLDDAAFSCGGLNPQGGQVDIAGPGVAVRSSWPRPLLHRSINGTSMATPHVTGAAALYASTHAGATAAQIRQAILGSVVATPSLNGKTVTGGRLNVSGF